MDDEAKLFIQRAENELIVAEILFNISINEDLQKNQFNLSKEFTFYSSVITHTYYSIFYSAKAILLKNNIRTTSPNIHKTTLDAFEKNLVQTGKLDVELLKIYRSIIVRAEHLLDIFSKERTKRGEFTYQKLPQANKEPANKSLENAKYFFKHIYSIL
jgi:uncharacterized protein (UPF0332 family)